MLNLFVLWVVDLPSFCPEETHRFRIFETPRDLNFSKRFSSQASEMVKGPDKVTGGVGLGVGIIQMIFLNPSSKLMSL